MDLGRRPKSLISPVTSGVGRVISLSTPEWVEEVIFFNAAGVERLNQPFTMDVTMDIRLGCRWHLFSFTLILILNKLIVNLKRI
jgi:hypothetical protein